MQLTHRRATMSECGRRCELHVLVAQKAKYPPCDQPKLPPIPSQTAVPYIPAREACEKTGQAERSGAPGMNPTATSETAR